VHRLQEIVHPSMAGGSSILLPAQDPANLYGSGSPFDISLSDGITRGFARRGGNWLVLRAGAPTLLIEQQGRRLTALPTASPSDLIDAVCCLRSLVERDRKRGARHKITVELWNDQPVVATEGKTLLEEAGFVRDYQALTFYAPAS